MNGGAMVARNLLDVVKVHLPFYLFKINFNSFKLFVESQRQLQRRKITTFTSEELADERIVYTHDDSESSADQFEFLPKEGLVASGTGFQYLGLLDISVWRKNDNPPVRIAECILHVVTNEQRVLSSTILRETNKFSV